MRLEETAHPFTAGRRLRFTYLPPTDAKVIDSLPDFAYFLIARNANAGCTLRGELATFPALLLFASLVSFRGYQQTIAIMVYDPPRAYERLPLPLETRLFGTNSARTRDICPGGCYIESVAHVTVGQFLVFEVQLPSGRWLELRGEVVYHRRNQGFGVSFIELPGESQKMLKYLIDYACGG